MTADHDLINAVLSEHPRDSARIIGGFPPAEVAAFFADWPPAVVARVAEALPAPALAAALASADPAVADALLSVLPLDTVAGALRPLGESLRSRLSASLDDRTRALLRERLTQAERTAGAVADREVVALAGDATVAGALDAVRHARGPIAEVFVVEPPAAYRGQIKLAVLLRAAPETPLRALLSGAVEPISMRTPVRAMTSHPGWEMNHTLAVVDDDGRLLGSVSAAQLARSGRPTTDVGQVGVAVSLAELGWLGLTGVLDGLAHVGTRPTTPSHQADAAEVV